MKIKNKKNDKRSGVFTPDESDAKSWRVLSFRIDCKKVAMLRKIARSHNRQMSGEIRQAVDKHISENKETLCHTDS